MHEMNLGEAMALAFPMYIHTIHHLLDIWYQYTTTTDKPKTLTSSYPQFCLDLVQDDHKKDKKNIPRMGESTNTFT